MEENKQFSTENLTYKSNIKSLAMARKINSFTSKYYWESSDRDFRIPTSFQQFKNA